MERILGRIVGMLIDTIEFLIVGTFKTAKGACMWLWSAVTAVVALTIKAIALITHAVIIVTDKTFKLLFNKMFWPIFSKSVPDKYKLRVLCFGFLGALVTFALTVKYFMFQ